MQPERYVQLRIEFLKPVDKIVAICKMKNMNDNMHTREQKKMKQDERNTIISGRCKVLAEMINNLRDIYRNGNENQRAFLETIIGAAIWYIPKPKIFWTGKISVNAIKSFLKKTKQKLSEEHAIPRKFAAKELLEKDEILTTEYVEKQYLEKYCKLHYITPEENKKAIKFQKTKIYKNSNEVYKKANIKLIKVTEEQLKKIKQGNEEVIKLLLKEL
jgi:hypothetical protein